MLPTAAGIPYHTDAVSNIPKSLMSALLLHVARQDAESVIAFLIGQAIPFQLRFSEEVSSDFPESFSEAGSSEREILQLTAREKTKAAAQKAIEAMYHKYVENVSSPMPAVSAVAREVEMGTHTFRVNFQSVYQKTFIQAHLEKRMEHAADLLLEGYSCKKVAQMVGYGERSAIKFNRMFQRYYGITPKKYQIAKNGV